MTHSKTENKSPLNRSLKNKRYTNLFNPVNFSTSKFCFVWNKYGYPSFLFICIRMVFPFPSLYIICISLYLGWVSCRLLIIWSFIFFISSDNFFLLTDVLRLLTFKVIIGIAGFIATIFVTVFYVLPLLCFPFCLLLFWTILRICLRFNVAVGDRW